MALDTTSATPLFQQLAEELRNALRAGEYPPGSQLPTEHQLCGRYGVSRVTVRKALEELSQRGRWYAGRGRAPLWRTRNSSGDLTSVLSFTEMCRRMGCAPGARTVKIALEPPDEEAAQELGLKKGEQMLVVERLAWRTGGPLCCWRHPLPGEVLFPVPPGPEQRLPVPDRQGADRGGVHPLPEDVGDRLRQLPGGPGTWTWPRATPCCPSAAPCGTTAAKNRYLCQQLCIGDKFKLMV